MAKYNKKSYEVQERIGNLAGRHVALGLRASNISHKIGQKDHLESKLL